MNIRMHLINKSTAEFKTLFKSAFLSLWTSCELFILIFLLLYVFFDSYWLIVCILFAVLGW